MPIPVLRIFDGPVQSPSVTSPETYGVKILTMAPELATGVMTLTSGVVLLDKFYCNDTTTISTVSSYVTNIAAGSSVYSGFGIYSDGATLTRLAQTPNDLNLYLTTGWKSLSIGSPITLTAGNFYWTALFGVFLTPPVLRGSPTGLSPIINGLPGGIVSAQLAGQTALPATILKSSLTGNAQRRFMVAY